MCKWGKLARDQIPPPAELVRNLALTWICPRCVSLVLKLCMGIRVAWALWEIAIASETVCIGFLPLGRTDLVSRYRDEAGCFRFSAQWEVVDGVYALHVGTKGWQSCTCLATLLMAVPWSNSPRSSKEETKLKPFSYIAIPSLFSWAHGVVSK